MDDKYTSLIGKFASLKESEETLREYIEKASEKVKIAEQAKEFLIQFSENSRDKIKTKLENIVNSALGCIFDDKNLKFKIMPNRTKKGLIYELYIETNGALTPIEDCKGGGVLDVVSMAIRISFVRLFSNRIRQVILLDEPFKNLDSKRILFAVEWLKTISKEFLIQFIVVSHEDAIIEKSDRVYSVSQVNGESKVELFK